MSSRILEGYSALLTGQDWEADIRSVLETEAVFTYQSCGRSQEVNVDGEDDVQLHQFG